MSQNPTTPPWKTMTGHRGRSRWKGVLGCLCRDLCFIYRSHEMLALLSLILSAIGVAGRSSYYPRSAYEGIAMSDEKRLIKHLLENYEHVGIVGRPVYNTSETVQVDYGLALIQILDLDEKNQVLTTNVWSRYAWRDNLLEWDPKLFGDVKQVRVPVKDIWTPDIVLYNYADVRLTEHREALAVVQNTGDVLWIPMSIFKSTCSIDILYFPYDSQECPLKFGSWTYDGFKLDLKFYDGIEQVDVTDYTASNEWLLLEHPARKNIKYYPCCAEPYPDLTFTIKVKRLAIFYSLILILPCVLLSVLTLVIFLLPPENPAKMILGMNIFVAFFLLLRILASNIPPASSSLPLIGVYFCLNMVMITLSSFLTVIVINLYHRTDKKNEVPPWLKKMVVHGLSKAFGLHYERLKRNKYRVVNHVTHVVDSPSRGRKNSRDKKKKIKSPVLSYNKWEPPPYGYNDSPLATRHVTPERERASPLRQFAFEGDVKEIKRALQSFMSRLYERDRLYRMALEWRVVALCLDRIFFFIYLAITIIALATIFPWSEAVGSYG